MDRNQVFYSSARYTALLLLCSMFLLMACTPAPSEEPVSTAIEQEASLSESERLNLWFDEKYEEQLQFSPITLTILGRKDQYSELDDVSETAEAEQLAWRAATVKELKSQFDYALLSDDARISYDLWLYQYDAAVALEPFKRRGYVFNQMMGIQSLLPTVLINYHKVEDLSDLTAYISRLQQSGRVMEQLIDRARLAADEGVKAPYFAYEGVVTQSKAVVEGFPFDPDSTTDAAIYADIKQKANQLVTDGKLAAAEIDGYLQQAQEALLSSFGPAYTSLISWFENDLPNLSKEARGVWSLPDGEAYYNAMLFNSTTTAMSAEEIHQLGLSEVARLRAEMEQVKNEMGFDGSLNEFFDYSRSDVKDERFFYPDTDAGRQAYLDDSTAYIEHMKTLLPDYFGRLPKADLVVKRVEAFREEPGAAQHYFPSSPDGSTPGVYYVHLSDMTMMPKNEQESVAYHEGVPGHHMQVAIALELEEVPTFRTQAGFTAYVEGWALYAELLAKEMGVYQEPLSDFGRLHSEMWRAIRLVLDTGIHAKRWTEQQAIDYFIANTPIAEGQAISEVRRYFVMPGQATAYKIGMLKILELREQARTALGDEFDIKAFHDLVLGGGAVPLSVLQLMVDQWIAAQQ